MVSVFDTLFQATAMPVLSSMLAPSVSRNGTAISAALVVSFIEEPSIEIASRGKEVRRVGVLRVKDTQTLLATDSYSIDSVTWKAVEVWHEAGGMTCARVHNVKTETRNKAGVNVV